MKRIFAVTLIALFLFVSCTGAFAANTATDPAQQQAVGARPGSNNSNAQLNSAVNSLGKYYTDYFLNSMSNKGATWLGNTSLDFSYGAMWNSFTYQFDTVQPLTGGNWLEKSNLPFLEAGIFGDGNSDTTINVGLGYRHLTAGKNILMGANVFWDYGNYNNNFNPGTLTYHSSGNSMNHQRIGVGIEYMQSYFEGYANYYLPITARQYLGQDQNYAGYNYYQEALSGYDVAVSAAIPGAEWLKANLRGYQYFGDNTNNIVGSNGFMNGLDFGATAQIMPQLSVSGGYDTGTQGGYVKGSFNLLAMPVPALFGGDKTINNYAQYNLSNKMLNRVQRNNVITVANERQSRYSGGTIAVVYTVTDWKGGKVAGIPCTLANSLGTYSETNSTNSAGVVTFNVPKTLWVTGAVSDGATDYSMIWNFQAQFLQWTQAGADPEKGTWSTQTVTSTVAVKSSQTTVTGPTIVVAPQPTQEQQQQGTKPSDPTGNPTYCTVTVKNADGSVAKLQDFKAILLDPTRASSTDLPEAVIISSDPENGTFTFEARLSPSCGGDQYEDSGAYGIAVTPVGENTAYGDTVNLTAYTGNTPHDVTINKTAPKRNVSVTVRDSKGNPVPNGTLVRAGSSIGVISGQYSPASTPTVNGVATFSDVQVGENFYVLAYTYNAATGVRTVVASGQYVDLNGQFPSGTISLSVQQMP